MVFKDRYFKCTYCGKRTLIPYITDEWGWNIGTYKFCNYSCMNGYIKKHNERKGRGRMPVIKAVD